MSGFLLRRELERRYDGPIPASAAVPPDFDQDLATQIGNRRRWAWARVRRIGHRLAAASRDFRATGDIRSFRRWNGLRRDLAHALRGWAVFRDWSTALADAAQDRDD